MFHCLRQEKKTCSPIDLTFSLQYSAVLYGISFHLVYPRFAPTMEWDTAAGHAIAKASGAEIYQAGKEEPLKYNKPDLLNPWFVVKRN